MGGTEVVLDVEVIGMVVGTVIPFLVGLLTKLDASGRVKAIANAFLSALAGVLASIQGAGGEFLLEPAIVTTLLTWAVSVATYYGLWKPTDAAEVVQVSSATFGVGGNKLQSKRLAETKKATRRK